VRTIYSDATTCGTLRRWKTGLAIERDRIYSVLDDRSGARFMQNFMFKNSAKGRSRALKRGRRLF
jgi:hypothetical protein